LAISALMSVVRLYRHLNTCAVTARPIARPAMHPAAPSARGGPTPCITRHRLPAQIAPQLFAAMPEVRPRPSAPPEVCLGRGTRRRHDPGRLSANKPSLGGRPPVLQQHRPPCGGNILSSTTVVVRTAAALSPEFTVTTILCRSSAAQVVAGYYQRRYTTPFWLRRHDHIFPPRRVQSVRILMRLILATKPSIRRCSTGLARR